MIQLNDKFGYANYSCEKGYFFDIKNENQACNFMQCRVDFARYVMISPAVKRIGFAKTDYNLKLINKFWNFVARKLGTKTRPTFIQTNKVDFLIIDIPEFWLTNDTRRSLFTLLLRCSAAYYKGRFQDGINTYDLASRVSHAIQYFLAGNTTPTYQNLSTLDDEGYTGFVAQFEGVEKEKLAEFLVK